MKAKEIEKRFVNIERKYRQLEYMMDLDGSTKRTIEAMEEAYKREKELNELTCNNLKSLAIKQIENEKKEEVKFETKIPLFEIGELEYFDCNMQSIIDSLLEMKLKEKDHILFQRIIKKQEEEIETLTNIIKSARDLFYEKCRIRQNGVYTFNQVDYEELFNILGSDK